MRSPGDIFASLSFLAAFAALRASAQKRVGLLWRGANRGRWPAVDLRVWV